VLYTTITIVAQGGLWRNFDILFQTLYRCFRQIFSFVVFLLGLCLSGLIWLDY